MIIHSALLRSRLARVTTLLLWLSGVARAEDDVKRCTYVDVGGLPIRYVGENLMPAVEGTINDTPAVMLVDTGAFETSLTRNGATRRDLGLFATGRWVHGIGGRSRLYTARLKDFSIGPIHSGHRTSRRAA